MNHFCSLCLSKPEEFIEIYSEYGKEQNIAAIITKYFWFEILLPTETTKSPSPAVICTNCWWSIDAFNKLYITVETVHSNYKINPILLANVESSSNAYHKEIDPQMNSNLSIIDDNITNNESVFTKYENVDTNMNDATDDNDDKIQLVDNASKIYKLKTNRKRLHRIKSSPKNQTETAGKRKYNKMSLNERLTLKNVKEEKRTQIQEKFNEEANEMRQYFDMKCELCEKILESLSDAHQHYRIEHNIKGYLKCCGRKFFNRCRVFDHIQYHINPNIHSCQICNKSYRDKNGLNNHMEMHLPNESKQYKCNICALSFAKQVKLSQHLRRGHSDRNEKNFVCDICNRSYVTKVSLGSHIRLIHLAPIRHVCDICAKIFKSKKVLEDHRSREHLNVVEPRVQCSLCGAWLKHLDGLRKHLIRHKNGPQTCIHCGKIKPNKDALREHVRYVHATRIEMHTCTICDKSFKRSITLKEHMASHTGESLYNCPHCPKTFNSNANMHSHRKKIHPIEWQEARLKRQLQ